MNPVNQNKLQQFLAQDLSVSLPSANGTAGINASVHATTPQGVTYRQQVGAINCLSYSTQTMLHTCPRRFLLEKLTANQSSEVTDNIDFLFGHAVGAGIQNYLLTKDIHAAMWDAFLSWKGDLLAAVPRKCKSFADACVAIKAFSGAWDTLSEGWELAILDNGKPAIEIAFALDIENGYIYLGHIDVILWNPDLQQFMVLELKTTGFTAVHEAQYKNSAQALGYSVILDLIAKRMGVTATNYSVLYLVYKTGSREYVDLPFYKTKSQRAAWLLQLRMDCTMVDFYRDTDHFPTHGESCYHFFRPCEFFGTCDMLSYVASLQEKFMRVAMPEEEIAGVDYYVKVSELEEITIS